MTAKWKLILETEHGKLFSTEAGVLKAQVRCRECGLPIEVVQRSSYGKFAARRWVTEGNESAVCNVCAGRSGWKRVKEAKKDEG